MNKMTNNFHNLVKFLEMAGRLKRTVRTGWVDAGVRCPESVADHTFRTAILCMIYADIEGLNQLKMLKMALIHDLPEAIIGDLPPSKKTAESKEKENTAITQILNLLPKRQRKAYVMIWNEYLKGKTKEAIAVRQLEKIEMAMQSKEYENLQLTDQSLKRFIESAKAAIIWPKLKRFLAHILEDTSSR